jgi:hypothetical protein
MSLTGGIDRDDATSAVTLQFRHDQKNSGVSRHGQLHPGGRLRVEYDPARLLPEGVTRTTAEVICHVRFQPTGERRSGGLVEQPGSVQNHARVPRPSIFEVGIPIGSTQVEVWFEGRASTGTTGWDSRYGQNYTFPVVDQGLPIPEPSVKLRPGTRVDATRISVVEDAASKDQVAMGGRGTRLRTALVVRARIAEPSASAIVWADLHVFDATGELIHTGEIALEEAEPSEADEVLRVWDAEVYPGSGGASGMGVWSRPDAHTIHYRLYCQVNDEVFTDGVLHQFDVPADTDVRPIPGGW